MGNYTEVTGKLMQIWDNYLRKSGLLFVVSGPSGVGKDAVLSELHQIMPEARRCVTCTTRAPRESEVDGVDYNFLSESEFRSKIESGGFLEYAEYVGNFYGTPRKWVEDHTNAGEDVILKIEVQGGLSVKRQMPEAVMVFLVPPSMEELERRLRSRLTDSEEQIAGRLKQAQEELAHLPDYNYIVENDSLRKAAEDLRSIIVAEHCRIQR